MPKHCIVKGCNSSSEKGFSFPLDKPELVRRWVAALETHQELPINYESMMVCSEHFLETDYLKSKKCKINRKAVPSVFPKFIVNVSEREANSPKTEIKPDPEETYLPKPGSKNLRRKRLTIPVTEPDSEEDVGSDYEPSEGEEEMSYTGGDSERMDNIYDNTPDNLNQDFRSLTSVDPDASRPNDFTVTFIEIGNEEILDSDYDPVSETSLLELKEKANKKYVILHKERSKLILMKELIKNQAATIFKLEEELVELMKAETDDNKGLKISDIPTISFKRELGIIPESLSRSETADYSNVDLQTFSISLYYFAPSVYSYLESIMPYLPPKKLVLEWVKSGHAFSLFPTGVLLKENFVLD